MTDFDPLAKEEALRAESEAWDTSAPVDARPGDVPVIDISGYLESRSDAERLAVAEDLRHACETVGFWQLAGHGIAPAEIEAAFAAVRQFHALPVETKQQVLMDRPDWPLGGVGYLPVGNRKLPARSTGNENEAFIIKGDRDLGSDSNQWLPEDVVPGFRGAVERFSALLEQLTLDLLPLYATALDVAPDWFAPGFEHPFWRLRMTRYPANRGTGSPADLTSPSETADGERSSRSAREPSGFRRVVSDDPTSHSESAQGKRSSRSAREPSGFRRVVSDDPTSHSESAQGERSSRSAHVGEHGSGPEVPTTSGSEARVATTQVSADLDRKSREKYGINPHVDTTFFTLLLQDSPGLTIYHTPSDRWLNVPMVENAFVVNSGELLRQWTNDRFLSVRHFANSTGSSDRHSIPFFVNATRDYPMQCIPTCCSEDNPPKYPTISYNESQGVVQGE